MADKILVNSQFTKTTFQSTFRITEQDMESIKVLYPGIDINEISGFSVSEEDFLSVLNEVDPIIVEYYKKKTLFTVSSINRFERKKNLELVIESFQKFVCSLSEDARNNNFFLLLLGGGYDSRLKENIEYFSDLEKIVQELKLNELKNVNVLFWRSMSEKRKLVLLRLSDVLIYSPENEHFGIVPVEAMANKIPVLAVNSGGPMESVVNGETGWLLQNDSKEFATKLMLLFSNSKLRSEIGEKSLKNVMERFSMNSFGSELHTQCKTLIEMHRERNSKKLLFLRSFIIMTILAIFLGVYFRV